MSKSKTKDVDSAEDLLREPDLLLIEGSDLSTKEEKILLEVIKRPKWTRLNTERWIKKHSINGAFINRAERFLMQEHRDIFRERIILTLFEKGNDGRNALWDYNHIQIILGITLLTKEKNRFPTRTELSNKTGLSRQTIDKHLKEYFGSHEYIEKQNEYMIMREKVLANVFCQAEGGDIRAAKVFLDATENVLPNVSIRNQNNFIQINGIVISQEQIKELPESEQVRLAKLLSRVPVFANPKETQLRT